jgi:hypothetical protein
MSSTEVVERHPILEQVFDTWAAVLGPARSAYRGHAYRVYNFARAIAGSPRWDDVLAIASAYHDLGIWSDRTFDYLAPSVQRAADDVREHRLEIPVDIVADIIANQHALVRMAASRRFAHAAPHRELAERALATPLLRDSAAFLRGRFQPISWDFFAEMASEAL